LQKSWRNIAIALAGIAQAARLVELLAKTGYLRTDEFTTCIKSLLVTDSDTTEEVFGDISQLSLGFEVLLGLLNDHKAANNADILRYILGVMHLQKRLSRKSDMLQIVGTRLEKVETQAQHFGIAHDNVIANIAELYSDTISKFQYRIQVTGEFNYLQQARLANQVRALLLAAIRATTLWRQVGGSRWQLIWYRSQIAEVAQDLLKESQTLPNVH
jgi:high frequency lysogenization protein